jgi:hypothetical protein
VLKLFVEEAERDPCSKKAARRVVIDMPEQGFQTQAPQLQCQGKEV